MMRPQRSWITLIQPHSVNGGNRNMKETYEELDMEIIVFEGDDVIVMSPDPLDPTGPDDVPIA